MEFLFINDIDDRPYIVEKPADMTTIEFFEYLVGGSVKCLSSFDPDSVHNMWVNIDGSNRDDFFFNKFASFIYENGGNDDAVFGPVVYASQNGFGDILPPNEAFIQLTRIRFGEHRYSGSEMKALREAQMKERFGFGGTHE